LIQRDSALLQAAGLCSKYITSSTPNLFFARNISKYFGSGLSGLCARVKSG